MLVKVCLLPAAHPQPPRWRLPASAGAGDAGQQQRQQQQQEHQQQQNSSGAPISLPTDEVLRRAAAVLAVSSLRSGQPPIECTCEEFEADLCFAPSCEPCSGECLATLPPQVGRVHVSGGTAVAYQGV